MPRRKAKRHFKGAFSEIKGIRRERSGGNDGGWTDKSLHCARTVFKASFMGESKGQVDGDGFVAVAGFVVDSVVERVRVVRVVLDGDDSFFVKGGWRGGGFVVFAPDG
jgi:hypothetical protein